MGGMAYLNPCEHDPSSHTILGVQDAGTGCRNCACENSRANALNKCGQPVREAYLAALDKAEAKAKDEAEVKAAERRLIADDYAYAEGATIKTPADRLKELRADVTFIAGELKRMRRQSADLLIDIEAAEVEQRRRSLMYSRFKEDNNL